MLNFLIHLLFGLAAVATFLFESWVFVNDPSRKHAEIVTRIKEEKDDQFPGEPTGEADELINAGSTMAKAMAFDLSWAVFSLINELATVIEVAIIVLALLLKLGNPWVAAIALVAFGIALFASKWKIANDSTYIIEIRGNMKMVSMPYLVYRMLLMGYMLYMPYLALCMLGIRLF